MGARATALTGPREGRTAKVVATTLPAESASAGAARRFVTSTLSQWHALHLADTAMLLTSELVTNAVLHARSAVIVRLAQTRDGIRCDVTDRGPGQPLMRTTQPEDLNGRGLQLVDEMSRSWGVLPTPGGKTVWFELVVA